MNQIEALVKSRRGTVVITSVYELNRMSKFKKFMISLLGISYNDYYLRNNIFVNGDNPHMVFSRINCGVLTTITSYGDDLPNQDNVQVLRNGSVIELIDGVCTVSRYRNGLLMDKEEFMHLDVVEMSILVNGEESRYIIH